MTYSRNREKDRFQGKVRGLCKGFSLVELMVVLALVAMLAASVQLVLSGPLQLAQTRNAIEKFRLTDGQIRQACQKQGLAAKLFLNTSDEAVVWEFEGKDLDRRSFVLSGLTEIRSSSGIHRDWETRIDRWGRSESFAIRIGKGEKGRWLLCSGISGQILEIENGAEVEAVLSQLTPGNHTR